MQYDPSDSTHRSFLADSLRQIFATSNFVKLPVTADTFEEVYSFKVPTLPGASIEVFSTIQGGQVRALGADAIRVMTIYTRQDGTVVKLFKSSTIHRTGQLYDIPARTQKRMREAYSTLADRVNRQGLRCHCGAPKFDAKSGNKVCAALCWK